MTNSKVATRTATIIGLGCAAALWALVINDALNPPEGANIGLALYTPILAAVALVTGILTVLSALPTARTGVIQRRNAALGLVQILTAVILMLYVFTPLYEVVG